MTSVPDGQLLYACHHSYCVTTSGPVPGDPRPLPLVPGYTDAEAFVAGPANIDAALLARAADRSILAFRGTQPPTDIDHPVSVALDWLNDAAIALVPWTGGGARVHRGFLASLDNLWPALEPVLLAQAQSGRPFALTGHSKGGAVAALAAVRLRGLLDARHLANPIALRGFAAPRPGESAFADLLLASDIDAVRYEYADDAVPLLPPGSLTLHAARRIKALAGHLGALPTNYASVGVLRFIGHGGLIDPVPPSDIVRLMRIVTAELANPRAVVQGHGIGPGSGYFKAFA